LEVKLSFLILNLTKYVHWGISNDSLCYWQEIGRAGQDGMPAHAYLFVVPKLFNRKVQDRDFIDLMKKLADVKVVTRRMSNRSIATQTTESPFAELSISNSAAAYVVKPTCLRQIILPDLATEQTQSAALLVMHRTCTGQFCLKNCCTFCRDRCSC